MKQPSNWFYNQEPTEKPYIVEAQNTAPSFRRTPLYSTKYSIDVGGIGAVLPASNTINYNSPILCYLNPYPPSFLGAMCDPNNPCTGE